MSHYNKTKAPRNFSERTFLKRNFDWALRNVFQAHATLLLSAMSGNYSSLTFES